MATFAIGDVQGCYDELVNLLELIDFNREKDTLWFAGDLVNRGPKSLEVLRYVSQLPRAVTVLGNHDLTLLALAYTDLPIKQHNLHDILIAPDREELLGWLRERPLLYQKDDSILVHAGIPPTWTLSEAQRYAKEVADYLMRDSFRDLLVNMFGNEPSQWSPKLTGWERYRFIINGLTRMRFCDQDGRLDFTYKGDIESAPPHLIPWYEFTPTLQDTKILFGHWAAIQGRVEKSNIEALDTGCYWGGALTALRLEDGKRFSLSCPTKSS